MRYDMPRTQLVVGLFGCLFVACGGEISGKLHEIRWLQLHFNLICSAV